MKNFILGLFVFLPFILQSQVLDTLTLNSKYLNRKIEVITVDYPQKDSITVNYLTDGRKLIGNQTAKIIDSLVQHKKIEPAKYVFISSIDPTTNIDYRNNDFFCNENYLYFIERELIAVIETDIKNTKVRNLIGVSFGGLNVAYFASKSNLFRGYAMLSPITYPCDELNQELILSEIKNYKVYISTGKYDAETYVNKLLPILQSKTSKIKYIETNGHHDFANWNKQLGEMFQFLNK